MEIGSWLGELGLGHLERLLRDGGIGLDVLPELADADLKELGLNLGDRKRLMKAIAALGAEPSPGPGESPAPSATPRAREAERRQLTVMFVDLVGSTALSQRLDPEEMRDVLTAYQNAVVGEISRLDGFTAKLMGDGVLAYFGWPRAHEDEAERAVRAGLAIVGAVAKLEASEPLACRVGIATGLVVVGDLIGEGASQEEAVVGDTPNLAARLQALAEPGQVVVAEATRRLLGAAFAVQDLGAQTLKGMAKSLPAFRILGERVVESRFAGRAGEALLSMVGREQELALLLERWRQARRGEGQLVLLVGEAGIGKSRIMAALIDAVEADEHVRIRYQCSPYHADSALYPTIQQLTLAAGLEAADTTAAKLDKLERLLARAGTDGGEAAPLLAALLGLAGEDRYGPLDLSPQQQRARTLEVLVGQLTGLAERQPVLFLLEDAHWIDPTTLELIELALDRVQASRVLLLVTARPTFEHRFGGHPIVTRLTLNRLGREQVLRIVERISGGKALPVALVDEIAARTDGVPLFVEEMTKAVLESGMLRETEAAWVLDGPLRALAIPTSLHDSLMARLDRLQPVKQVAQTAACIGREFDHRLLAAISPLPEPELLAALGRLVEAELVFRRGTPPEAHYQFKHALVRDAAYESLLKTRRQELHGAIALALEQRFSEIVRDQPELLARHLTEAGRLEAAVPYWQRAGERAARTSANVEAVAHFRQAIALLTGMPVSDERQRLEMQLQTQLALSLGQAKGPGSPATAAAFARAKELSEWVGDAALMFPVLYGQWLTALIWAEHPRALEIADRLVQVAEGQADTGPTQIGHRNRGITLFNLGRTTEAVPEIEQALTLYQPDQHAVLAHHYGVDVRVLGLTYWALAQWELGHPERASRSGDKAIDHAKRSNHANSLATALNWAGVRLRYFLGETDAVGQHARELTVLAERHGMAMWLAYAHVSIGWHRARDGEAVSGITMIHEGLTEAEATGALYWRPFSLLLLADAQLASGAVVNALATLDEALAGAIRRQELVLEPELHRRRAGVLLNMSGRAAETEACLEAALAIARRRQTRSWELRAARDLARLWAERGERLKAHDLLSPIYGWFTEGFEFPDLVEAKALLDELR